MRSFPLVVVVLIGLLWWAPAGAQETIHLPAEVFSTPGPHVVVNGALLKAPVKRLNGSLVLPMRAVFEALQAEVKWFPAAQQIIATRGATVVQLWINRTTAIIGETEVTLVAPPMLLDGTTFVPLRFPAEAFGGDVKWNGPLQTAVITIPPLDAAPPAVWTTVTPVKTADTGVIIGKTAELGQMLLVLDAAGDAQVRPLGPGVLLTRGPAGGAAKAAAFAELQPGDAVTFTNDAAGKLSAVAATFAQVSGKVAAIANNKLMLQDGSLYQLHPEVKTADAAGAAVALTAIGNGHDVTLRVTPGTTTAWAITVPADAALAPVPPAAAQPTILTVGAQGYAGPVKAGGSVTIQVSGTPHADRVTARIGDVLQPVTLHEVEPGKYQASITVAPNTNATNVPIIAAMTLGGVTSAEVKSAQLITLDTTPPVFNALIPAQDAQVFERAITIQAAFSDPGGSGVNPAAVTLTVNGMDVTKTATVTEKGISFTVQNLALGVLPIRLQIADQAKNAATVAWNVTVATPPAAQAATLAHDAAAAITAGKVVTFTAKLLAAPVKMEWYLGNTLLAGTPTRVAGTNTYTLAYTIAAGDAIGAHAASIRVFSNATQSQVIFAPTPVVIAAPVRAFAVTAPADKSAVTPQLAVTGEAPAGSPVRVTVSYSKVALILVMQGDLYKGTVVAGDDGKWTTPAFETELLLIGKVDQYSVKAELLDGNGATVQTITRTLTPR